MRQTYLKSALLGGVSALAIAVVNPAPVLAADLPDRLPMRSMVSPLLFTPSWNWWIEGGASNVSGGDPYIGGLTPPFTVMPEKWRMEGAVGFDYRFDPTWHVSAQFRYGQNRARSKSSSQNASATIATAGTPGTATVAGVWSNAAERKENHWLADFMVGRDMNVGLGYMQAKIGVRVASIRGKTTGSIAGSVPTATLGSVVTASAPAAGAYTQENKFFGIGPRMALEGSVPLGDGWSFDYNLGVAALFGDRKLDQTATFSGAAFTCVTGCPINISDSSSGAVFNFDAQPGLAYAFNQNVKLTASYRFDGYWNAMRTVDAVGNISNVDRYYQGGFLRLGVSY